MALDDFFVDDRKPPFLTVEDGRLRVDLTHGCSSLAIPAYLVASYAYYVMDDPVMADEDYDQLCKKLDTWWFMIDHPHKKHVDREAVRAGTGYGIDYPERVVGAYQSLVAGRLG
jgi:hypothetical protein